MPHHRASYYVAPLLFLGLSCSDQPAGLASVKTERASPPPIATATRETAGTAAASVSGPVEEIAAQHVLIKFKGVKNSKDVTRSKADAKKLAEEVRDKARNGEDFSALVAQYSEDTVTRDGLGSLGKFKRSEMVKEFSNAAFGLAVGGVSDAVETGFGYHVIKRNQ